MAKVIGAIGGIIRGKTGSINTKYSAGKNVASQYVPVIRNPKTEAQVTQRFRLKFLSKLFSEMSSTAIRIGFDEKTLSGFGAQLILNSLSGQYKNLPSGKDATYVTMNDFIDYLQKNVKGKGNYHLNTSDFIKQQSIMSDMMAFSYPVEKNSQMFFCYYKADSDNVLRNMPNFVVVEHDGSQPTQPLDLLPWSICIQEVHNFNEEDQTGYTSYYPYLNLGSGGVVFMFQLSFDHIVQSKSSLVVPCTANNNFIENDVDNLGLYPMNPSYFSSANLSKISKKYGINFFPIKDNSFIIEEQIDYSLELPNDAFTLSYVQTLGGFEATVTVNEDRLPFALNGNERIMFGFKYTGNDLVNKTSIQYSSAGELEKTFNCQIEKSVYPVRISVSITTNSVQVAESSTADVMVLAKPLNGRYYGDGTLSEWESFWGNYNENPFRFPLFSNQYNFAMRFVGNQEGVYNYPVECVCAFNDENDATLFSLTTNSMGCVYKKIESDCFIKSIVLNDGTNEHTIVINKQIYANQFNYAGSKIFDWVFA